MSMHAKRCLLLDCMIISIMNYNNILKCFNSYIFLLKRSLLADALRPNNLYTSVHLTFVNAT